MKKQLILTAAVLISASAMAQPQLTKDNIDEVLAAMTLEEKATLVVGSGWGSMTGAAKELVSGAAGTTQAIPRLGIPQTVLSDGPAGLRINPTRPGDPNTYYCTGFPVGTLLACTWNTDLVYKVGEAIGNETLEYGADVILGPGMNLHRNPLNGRNFEYYSEDPVLTGETAAAMINGIQSNGVGVSAKHFAVNSQETNRMQDDARVSPRALRELYLKGFEIAVRKAQPWTIMSSYNKINGTWAESNRDLLTTILRDEWGFQGMVMTDWTGLRITSDQILAGNDLMEPGDVRETQELIEKVKSGELAEADLDICVRRVLEFIVKTPRFEGYKYSNKPDLKAHAQVTRKAAVEGMVLLKNENDALPMDGVSKIALYGVTSYDFIAGGTGSGNVNKPYVVSLLEGLDNNGYELVPEVKDYYQKYIAFEKARIKSESVRSTILLGDPVISEIGIKRSFIEKNEPLSDIAVITIGRNAGEGADRKLDADFLLTADERQLITDVCDTYHYAGKKVVVILNVGGVIETASWKAYPDAILLAWQPGEEGGNSVADVLKGVENPSGKLSMTWPVTYFDHPSSFNFPFNYTGANSMTDLGTLLSGNYRNAPRKNVDFTDYAEGINVGYRYFVTAGKEVSYPFGYGLSYTKFEYGKPVVKLAKDGTVTVSVAVKNVGKVAGKEIVEVYVAAPAGGLEKPARELKAYGKTASLAPGESETLVMSIDPYSLASFNESSSAWETAAGAYKVLVGASVDDIRGEGGFSVKKPLTWPAHAALLKK